MSLKSDELFAMIEQESKKAAVDSNEKFFSKIGITSSGALVDTSEEQRKHEAIVVAALLARSNAGMNPPVVSEISDMVWSPANRSVSLSSAVMRFCEPFMETDADEKMFMESALWFHKEILTNEEDARKNWSHAFKAYNESADSAVGYIAPSATPAITNEEPTELPAPGSQDELLLDGILEHAQTWYNQDGWDFLLECYTKAEVYAAIKGATTHRGCIIRVRRAFGLIEQNERRREVQSEVF